MFPKKFSKNIYYLVILSPLLNSPCYAYSLDLDAAEGFNAVIFGDMSAEHSDVEGALAVGGNLTLNNYAIGLQLSVSNGQRDDLIVGGDLSFTNGRVYHGNARSGGTAHLSNVGFNDENNPHQTDGSYIPGVGNSINFASVEQQLAQNSLTWAGYATNTTTALDTHGELHLNGSDALVNVFSVSAEQLLNTNVFTLDIPDNAWALINISGTDVNMQDFGFFRSYQGTNVNASQHVRHDGGLTQNILFNLAEATSLNITGTGVAGSILAPFADTVFYNAHIDGQLITQSLTGMQGEFNGQLNHYNFTGTGNLSSDPLNLPEPSTLWLLGISSLLLLHSKRAVQR